MTEDEYAERLTAALRRLRDVAPACRWIEVFNETEVGDRHLDDHAYFQMYRLVCRATAAINAARGASGEATTDESGDFLVTGLGKGPFVVEVSAEREGDDEPWVKELGG